MMIIATIVIIKTHALHKKHSKDVKSQPQMDINGDNIIEKCSENINNTLQELIQVLNRIIDGVTTENLKELRATNKKVKEINKKSKRLKDNIHLTVKELQEDSIETGHYYVQVLDYLREIGHAISFISKPSLDHVDNNHKVMIPAQAEELENIKKYLADFIANVMDIISSKDFERNDLVFNQQQNILNYIDKSRKNQIKRIKRNETGTRNSMLFLNIVQETKNLTLYIGNLLKSYRDFVIYDNNKNNKS